jgi:hypothetical protein
VVALAEKTQVEQELTQRRKARNAAHASTDWQFTTGDARTKLKRLYPSFIKE